jgi:protein required for attachment to host cells
MTYKSSEHMTGVTWVVVADASQADIYSRQKRFSPLESVQRLTEPEARSKERDLASDAPGRTFDSQGAGRHAMEPDHTGKEHLRESFVHRIADVLESARKTDRFQQLVIVAAPAVLGELRAQLSSGLQRQIVAEFDKHMTDQEPAAIVRLIDAQS